MATIAVKFQSPRNNGAALVGFSVLGLVSQLGVRTLFQSGWTWTGEQIMQFLPVTSLCHVVASGIPIGGWLGGFCPWVSLFGTAVRVLCGAL